MHITLQTYISLIWALVKISTARSALKIEFEINIFCDNHLQQVSYKSNHKVYLIIQLTDRRKHTHRGKNITFFVFAVGGN